MGKPHFHPALYGRDPKVEALQAQEAKEKRRADAQMAYDLANLKMPDDIRARAKSWGMEAWATVLWNNAFQAGYREAMRDKMETDRD